MADTDRVESARHAGLRYTHDDQLTITRFRRGKRFIYKNAKGKIIKSPSTIARINKLAIPPAYHDLKISADKNSHLQAIGFDDRGRKQYRYHPLWSQVRDATKYHRTLAFGKKLPIIRKYCQKHLKLPGLPREKVLAAVVSLLEKTLIRVGNVEYAKDNDSFGLTTMRNKHVSVHGSKIHFSFRGKSKIHHEIDLQDQRLAKIIKNCQEVPGHELFEYKDESGTRHVIRSEDVNHYLKEIAGEEFSAKDFRTWAGTVLAAQALKAVEVYSSVTEAKRNINKAIEIVAKKLGNTKSICRKCYVHPEILAAYMEKKLKKLIPREDAVLSFLSQRARNMS